jgi:hypothetical protein
VPESNWLPSAAGKGSRSRCESTSPKTWSSAASAGLNTIRKTTTVMVRYAQRAPVGMRSGEFDFVGSALRYQSAGSIPGHKVLATLGIRRNCMVNCFVSAVINFVIPKVVPIRRPINPKWSVSAALASRLFSQGISSKGRFCRDLNAFSNSLLSRGLADFRYMHSDLACIGSGSTCRE